MEKDDKMKVLITGGQGYVGSVLSPYLAEKGYDVTVLDRGFFLNKVVIDEFKSKGINTLKDDIRYFEPNLLKNIDSVVDLAALSNDPAGELDSVKTLDINYIGRSRVARLSKAVGVKRYVLASSCSIYGFQDHLVDEESEINPLTTYAKANYLAESDNLRLADETFSPVALRFATAFGASPRLRLDIAINAMTYRSVTTKKIRLMRDGNQFRPFVHVKDMARAIEQVLRASNQAVSGQLFNVGADTQNVRIKEIAEKVGNITGNKNEIEWYGDPDVRSYQVSFEKIKKRLGFKCKYSIDYGIEEMTELFSNSKFNRREDMFTVDHYKSIMEDPYKNKGMLYNFDNRLL